MAVETKTGVYCAADREIKGALNLEALEKVAVGEMKVAVFRTHEKISSAKGVELIRKDIAESELNRIVILDRSCRAYPGLFDLGPEVIVEQVPFRELVVWTHEPNHEDTQMLAEDYVRMFVAKVQRAELPEPEKTEISSLVMVIGGGVAGLRTALNCARTGHEVVLVEKEDHLGGWSKRWSKTFPTTPPYTEIRDNGIDDLIEAVNSEEKIKIHLNTTAKRIGGQPGMFEVTLQNGAAPEEFMAGAIIQATGWRPYEPEKLGHLGYGLKNVVTNVQLEDLISEGKVALDNGSVPKSIAFIQCAGSRDKEHLPYCSAVCCRASMKQAMMLRELSPDMKIFVLYKDIRSPGQYELFYQQAQDDPAIFFTKGEVVNVAEDPDGTLNIDLDDTLLGEPITVNAEMLVLAAGMVPSTFVKDIAMEVEGEEQSADAPVVEETTADGKKMAAGAEVGARILNLSYRQGTDLPTLKYGFPDSHCICFPYETRRTAIFAAGTVRAPMDIAQASMDANGASLKAVQAINLIEKGAALHPRSGDLSFPEFALQRCTQCKRCTEECPFGALDEDDKGTPEPNTNRCRRCGACMGACPERIVNFKDYSVPMGNNMIKAFEVPEEDEEKPRLVVFMCENDALPALEVAAQKRMKFNPWMRIIPVRCIGSVNLVWITNCLDVGADGILLAGCKHGDNYQCHFIRGSELADYRMEKVQEKLIQMALEEERVQVKTIAIDEWEEVVRMLDEYSEKIEEIGPNPFKDL